VNDNSQNFDPAADNGQGGGGGLPFKLNLQTVATIVLVLALLAILWLFFAPQPKPETTLDLPTATPMSSMATGAAPAGAGTVVAPAGTVAVVGSPAAAGTVPGGVAGGTPGAGTVVPIVGLGTPGPGTPTVAALSSGTLAAGQFAVVGGTDNLGIRLRFGPGATYSTIRIVMDGEAFKVLNGPEMAEGAAWWRVQDAQGNVGWAAEEYLKPTAAPANWAPPAASPTFEVQPDDVSGGAASEASATP
jgi:hypothetical protein